MVRTRPRAYLLRGACCSLRTVDDSLWSCCRIFLIIICFYLTVPMYCATKHISPFPTATRTCHHKRVTAKTAACALYSDPCPGCIWLFIFPLLHLKIHNIYDLALLCTFVSAPSSSFWNKAHKQRPGVAPRGCQPRCL